MTTKISGEIKKYVYQTQKHLHSIPEPAFQETKTAAFIASELEKMGYTVMKGLAGTGVTAYIEGKQKHPCIAIRADMDCIIHEHEKTIVYRHSCGHDAHSSIALGVAKQVIEHSSNLNGSIKFIFQPAEEIGQGAKAMTEAGSLDYVDYLIGYHLRMNSECPFGKMAPALLHSAASIITGEIEGKTAHGGRPHLGINAIDVLTSLLTSINTIRSNPLTATNVKFTKIAAGGGSLNVIPDKGTFAMDIRSGSNDELKMTIEKIKRTLDFTAEQYEAKIRYQISEGVPAPQYDENLVSVASEAIKKVLGTENVVDPIFTPGGEDFHYYTKLTDIKAVYLAIGADVSPGLHDPTMTFNKEAMVNGIAVITEMITNLLGDD